MDPEVLTPDTPSLRAAATRRWTGPRPVLISPAGTFPTSWPPTTADLDLRSSEPSWQTALITQNRGPLTPARTQVPPFHKKLSTMWRRSRAPAPPLLLLIGLAALGSLGVESADVEVSCVEEHAVYINYVAARCFSPSTLKPSILNPHPHPKPETRNPKTQTLNPEH